MKILYNNLADATVDGTTLTSDVTADVGYPLANLLNGLRTKTWRYTGAAGDHWIKFDFGTPQAVNAVALINTNLAAPGTLTIQGNPTDNWNSPSVNIVIGNTGVCPDGDELFAYFAGGSYRYWLLRFNQPNPYIGRIFLGDPLTPSANFKQGFNDFYTAVTTQSVSIGGQVFIDQRNKYRTLKLQFTGITDANKYAELLTFANSVGINKSFVATLDPTNNSTTGQTSIYCRLAAFPQFTQMFNAAGAQYHNAVMDLVESI